MPTSFTEIVQQSSQIDWNLAITWIVIVAVGCWLWAEFIEFLESRRRRTWQARHWRQMADWRQTICEVRANPRRLME
jgi:hypothetical protein